MTVAVPTLSSNGWVRAPADKADYLLAHFYESDKRQTYLYGENVTNLQWLIEQYGHDIILVCQEVRRAVQLYLSRYYDTADVQVTSDTEPGYTTVPNDTSFVRLRMVCTVTEEGKEYSIAKLIEISDGKFKKVVNLVNQGST